MKARLEGETLSLMVEQGEDGCAHLVWFGPKEFEEMAGVPAFQRLPASPDFPVGPVLMPEHGNGFHGNPQIEAHGVSSNRRIRLASPVIEANSELICLVSKDESAGLSVQCGIRFEGDALIIETNAVNGGIEPTCITRLASALLPAPHWAKEVLTHAGAWGREGHVALRAFETGRVEQLGRGGRPGFDGGPTLTLLDDRANEHSGKALTAHLAWSGPFRLAAERAVDGTGQILAEQLFAPGECTLEPGEHLDLPPAILALSHSGLQGVSDIFHQEFRRRSEPLKRRVHFNTWEARYFEVNEGDCIELAQQAAELGIERFVLDDGWFNGRNDDATSLGDWVVDEEKFPDGLSPLIDAVHAAGMDFGLWVEPEMVSPDSDLYRAHPDWVLGYPETGLPTGRNQLVLDLALPKVQCFLFSSISGLLDLWPIVYLKWDCNRDLYPATRNGVARAGLQTDGLYALLNRLRDAHPNVEIESCASGGGRIDAGIARYAQRFWTSDATDAIDRIRIQRAASLIVPPEMLGAHIGPSPNPMTGRQIPMAFRVLTAFFGHLGLEADPAMLGGQDRAVLMRGIDLYKRHRDWMSEGRLVRIGEAGDDPDVQILASETGDQALLRILRLNTPERPLQSRIQLAGLERAAKYELNEIALEGEPDLWPVGQYSGAGLMAKGLALDPGKALMGRLIHLKRIT
ncbi:alpha-galactosidase [Hyphobacterium sp.]|uniref:alpha-galactosidase n=1 Tax=Hyphobacterium sp. TaxID=2004662 RepID=UPI0037478DE3